MKKVWLALALLVPLWLTEARADPCKDDMELLSLVRESAAHGLDDLKAAGLRAQYEFYVIMYKNLRDADFVMASKVDCDRNEQALALTEAKSPSVKTFGGNITLCRRACNFFKDPNSYKAREIVVHESAHLSGVEDECKADWYAESAIAWHLNKPINPRTWHCNYKNFGLVLDDQADFSTPYLLPSPYFN